MIRTPSPSGTKTKNSVPRPSARRMLRSSSQGTCPCFFSTVRVFRAGPDHSCRYRVEELRLLSKAEEAGLLSAAEKAGLSLSSIEKMGLLSKAEDFGILTLATDTNAPALLTTVAVVCYALAPALVYFGPDDQFVAEAIGAALLALGGTAAFGGATLLGTLQKS